jgi:hypothetical protein
MGTNENQFSFTRAASTTSGAAKNQIPTSHGLWVLVSANGQPPLHLLNHKPILITNAAQHARLTEAWLANKHRASVPLG